MEESDDLLEAGKSYLQEGNLVKAEECLKKAYQHAQEIDERNGLVKSAYWLGRLCSQSGLGSYYRAEQYLQDALENIDQSDCENPSKSRILNELGLLFYQRNDFTQSLTYL